MERKKVILLADESANWIIAGLRQLERLALALSEFGQATEPQGKMDVIVFWNPEIPPAARWLPKESAVARFQLSDGLIPGEDGARILSTRLFFGRGVLGGLFQALPMVQLDAPNVDSPEVWRQLSGQFDSGRLSFMRGGPNEGCEYIAERSDIAPCEKRFLRSARKSDDGIVSRFLNRPISQAVTRVVLRTPISPNAWTFGIMIIPIVGSCFLLQGTHWSFVIGMILFQVHSALDGCDGEIARAKYLESEDGRRLDASCDLAATFLLLLSLGVGLFRCQGVTRGWRLLYLTEGILVCLLMACQWYITRSRQASFGQLTRRGLDVIKRRTKPGSVQPARAAEFSIGEGFLKFLVEMAKRDVAHLLFVILAVVGLTSWVLHIPLVFALASLTLSSGALISPRGQSGAAAQSPP
jgi:phosphatidylglycerophosphate synthase